jgi:hypothetical protein
MQPASILDLTRTDQAPFLMQKLRGMQVIP